MFRCLIVLFLILLSDFSFGQVVLTQTHSDATIGLDRKAWNGLGNTSAHSDGYAHDFTLPASTNPCQMITGITVEISHTAYTNNNVCPHYTTYYNLFYGCTSYAGGATCLPATNLIAEPNYAPNVSPPPFNFGSPLGSPLNSNIVPDFGDNLSIDIIPVSNPGCNPVTNGHISYQYTITVTVTITDLPPTPPTFTQVSAICSGDTLSALPTTSNEGITGTWSPALDNTTTTTYTFTPDSGQCATTQTMTIVVNTSVAPTLECWETATFNNTTCSWDVTGTQPVQPTLECYETATFNNATCVWDITGTQPTQPTLECWETATFNDTTCTWVVTGTQPTQPILECWETATFNNTTCSWDITGTQPTQPTLECWETATFNDTTCSWDVTGTQPIQPTLECWETTTFNDSTCAWDVTGTQPTQPTIDCWETATFNNTTCVWDITGTQPVQPTLECWETTTFNNTTCVWDVSGTQPTQPTLECWETATFNSTTCSWDVTGIQPVQPTLECWETGAFNNTTCVWDITGTQPTQPTLECWGTTTFNNTTCSWDVTGTQPPTPTGLQCWETTTFNTSTCVWDITGTQPTQPTLECWESATFNNTTCVWDVTGIEPLDYVEEHLILCEGEDLTMHANTNFVNPSFLWDTGEITESKTVSTPGTYIVEIFDNICSTTIKTIYVEQIDTPIIDTVYSDGSDIIITTLNSGDFEYSLNGIDFQSSNTFNNVEGGLYTVYVKGENCNETVTTQYLHFYIPKFFTPNADGNNDTFDLQGIEHFTSSQVYIFDRYGKLLKSSIPNAPFSWNGTFNNELLPTNDYWYIIIIEGQKFAGHFTLKR